MAKNQDGEVENTKALASVVEAGIFRKALKTICALLQENDQLNPKFALLKARAIAVGTLLQADRLPIEEEKQNE